MISRTLIENTPLQLKTIFGDLLFWNDPNNKHINSIYFPVGGDILKDPDFKSLLQFLNKDISELNKAIMDFIHPTTQADLTESALSKKIIFIADELTDWHPYLKYNCGIILLDIIVDYIITAHFYSYEQHIKTNAKMNMKTKYTDDYVFRRVYPLFSEYLSDSDIRTIIDYHESIIRLSLQTDGIDHIYTAPIKTVPFSPLDELEELQKFIIENLPQNRPDRNRSVWNKFIDDYCNKYGPLTRLHLKTYETLNYKTLKEEIRVNDQIHRALRTGMERLNKSLTSSVPIATYDEESVNYSFCMNGDEVMQSLYVLDYYKYTPENLLQFIQAQLIQLSESSCAIKYCPDCLQYYLQKPNCPHQHDEYTREMISIQEEARQKVCNTFYQYYYTDYSIQEDELFQFHCATYSEAIKQHLSPQQYKAYTSDEKYNRDNFRDLPSLSDYFQTQ